MATIPLKAFGQWVTHRTVATGSPDVAVAASGGPIISSLGWVDCQGKEKATWGVAMVTGSLTYTVEIWLLDADDNAYQAPNGTLVGVAYNAAGVVDLEGDWKAICIWIPAVSANSVTTRAKID